MLEFTQTPRFSHQPKEDRLSSGGDLNAWYTGSRPPLPTIRRAKPDGMPYPSNRSNGAVIYKPFLEASGVLIAEESWARQLYRLPTAADKEAFNSSRQDPAILLQEAGEFAAIKKIFEQGYYSTRMTDRLALPDARAEWFVLHAKKPGVHRIIGEAVMDGKEIPGYKATDILGDESVEEFGRRVLFGLLSTHPVTLMPRLNLRFEAYGFGYSNEDDVQGAGAGGGGGGEGGGGAAAAGGGNIDVSPTRSEYDLTAQAIQASLESLQSGKVEAKKPNAFSSSSGAYTTQAGGSGTTHPAQEDPTPANQANPGITLADATKKFSEIDGENQEDSELGRAKAAAETLAWDLAHMGEE